MNDVASSQGSPVRRSAEEWREAAEELGRRAGPRAREGEELRRLPDATARDIADLGFARMMTPRRFGGHEADFTSLVGAVVEVGKHCAATAWCTSLLASHGWLVGAFPLAAQEEVLASSPDVFVATQINPIGKLERTPEGYRLSGTWSLVSAIHQSEWVALGAVDVAAPPGPPDCLVALVRKSELSVRDTWNTVGLRASGSHTVVADRVVVPEHRVIRDAHLHEGTAPGGALAGAPALYRVPKLAGFVTSLIAPILGASRGCVDGCLARLRGRPPLPHGTTGTHLGIAEASAEVDAATLVVERWARDSLRAAEAGRAMPLEERLRARRDAAFAARLCSRATDRAVEVSGTGVLDDASPVQRAWRDVRVMSGHFALAFHAAGELWGAEATKRA